MTPLLLPQMVKRKPLPLFEMASVLVPEKLRAFVEFESAIRALPPFSDRRKLDNFLFEIGLSFAFRDE